MSENVVELTDATFQAEVLESELPVMIDIWAPWCGPCRMVTPVIEELADEHAGVIKVGKLNVDENQAIAGKLGINAIPAILFFNGGREETDKRLVGVQPKAVYQRVIEELI